MSTRFLAPVLIAVCSTVCSTAAYGQSFNVDSGPLGSIPPANSYGAAASQPGMWEPVYIDREHLADIDGTATPVRYFSEGGGVTLDVQGASPGDRALMESAIAVLPSRTAALFFHLAPGLYDAYVYCWAGNLLGQKQVTIRAFTGAGPVVGGVNYGTQWPGGQVLGETYDRLRVEVTPGGNQYLSISIQAPGDFNVINGVQLVKIPTPGTAAMLLPAGLAALSLRRR